jgi:hypothetical protein
LRCISSSKRIPDLLSITRKKHHAEMLNRPNALFIWIPKTAGTSLVDSISAKMYLSTKDLKYQFPGQGTVTFGHMNYLQLLEQNYVTETFNQSSFKFTVVRNPYDRAVSLFHYLIKMKDIPSEFTFNEFCHFISERGCEPVGLYNFKGLSQCNPQVRWLDGIEIDSTLRFENLSETFPSLCTKLDISKNNGTLSKKNYSKRSHYPQYYTQETKELVETFYAEDFDRLEYCHEQF